MSAPVETADTILTPKSTPESVSGRLEQAREKVEGVYRRSRDRAVAMEGELEDYVREKPLKSMLIAAGVGAGIGLVLGVLLARR